MKQPVNVDLTKRSCDWTPPTLTFGEGLTLAFAFTKNVNGNNVAPNLTFSGCQAAIGVVDARPLLGKWALQIGAGTSTDANTTAALAYNSTAAQLAAAINAVGGVVATYGTCTAQFTLGSWLLHFGNGSTQAPLTVVRNGLFPISFGDVMAWQVDGKWVQAVRLVQAPVSFNSAFAVVLPDAPTITRVQGGGTFGSVLRNEIQQLYVPPAFQGAYTINQGFAQTPLLSPDDGPGDLQTALASGIGDGFNVTLPLNYTFLLEFIDSFAGGPQDLLTVAVAQAPPGNLTVTLPLDTAELATLLRLTGGPVTVPLQVQVAASEDGGPNQQICALVIPVTIQPSLLSPLMETTPTNDWLVPPSPTSYVPFGTDNVLTGEKIYAVTVGDAVHTAIAIAHGLDSDDVQVFVRQNGDPGNQLVHGTDFSVVFNSANQVTITALLITPGVGAWRVNVVSAQTVASWAAGLTVTIGQVTGLEVALSTVDGRLTNLETLLPASASLSGAGASGSQPITRTIAPANGFLFAPTGIVAAGSLPAGTRPPYLLPAINNAATLGALPTSPLPAPAAGALYTVGADVLVPGGGGIRSSWAKTTDFVGSDGRILYPLSREGTTDSYYPKPFELTLFELYIDDLMFVSGTTLKLWFQVATQLLNLTRPTEAQWTVVIEQGQVMKTTDVGSDVAPWRTSPGSNTFATNLASVAWNTTNRLVCYPLLLTTALQQDWFGCSITNTAGVFTANGMYYNRIVAANAAAPAGAVFALRARLINFDVRNKQYARGWVSWALQPAPAGPLAAVIG